MELAELGELLEGLTNSGGMCDPETVRELVELYGEFSAFCADVVGEFDAQRRFEEDGFTSSFMFLRHAGLSKSGAGRMVATGRRMRAFPATAEAYRSGGLPQGHVDAIVANTPDELADQFSAQEAALLPDIARLTTGQAAIAMKRWRSYAEDRIDRPDKPQRGNEASFSITLNGRGELRASLEPATAQIVKTAMERLAITNEENEPSRSAAERRGDVVRDVFAFTLENSQAGGTAGRHRPHVTLMVNAETGDGWTLDGEPLADPIVTSWLCDSLVNRLVMSADGIPLDYGRSERTAPPNQWKAVATRDGGCRFPGCDRPPRWCHAHHLRHWTEGGRTDMDNLALLCTHHHRLIHDGGWHAKLLPDLTLEVTAPDGRVRTSRPRGLEPPRLL